MKVTLAREWADPEGTAHPADKTVEVSAQMARNLIHRGYARPADRPLPLKKKKEKVADNG